MQALRGGGLVAIPTETVYGLAADALDARACSRIFEVKSRPLTDPLIVHVPDPGWLGRLARRPHPVAMQLAEEFWPGPLTLVLPKDPRVPDMVTAGHPTVAIRMSAHPVMHDLLREFAAPVAAPSANRFGRISPTRAEHVRDELGASIDLILDGGPCEHGIESTIVIAGESGVLQILRPGPIAPSQLERFGRVVGNDGLTPSPGTMKSHYAPGIPLQFGGSPPPGLRCGLLAWSVSRPGFAAVEVLAPDGNPRTAATRLYSAMRALDRPDLDLIIADPPPGGGLCEAIRDRLQRAAGQPASGGGD